MNKTLTIENVDLQLLEEQRQALARVLSICAKGIMPSAQDLKSLEGIQNMLDGWSDVTEMNEKANET